MLISLKAQIYARAAKINHYKIPRGTGSKCQFAAEKEKQYATAVPIECFIFPSLGDRSNKSRTFPTPSSCAFASTSDFIPREKWSNKITESTRQQQTLLNQRSVPPVFPAFVSPSHFAHTSHSLILLSRFNEVLFRFPWSPCNLEIYDSTPLVCP